MSEPNYVNTNFAGYVKDETLGHSNAVLNIDSVGYTAYKEQREKNKKLRNLAGEVDSLKGDMQEIKNLLLQVLGKNNG